MAAPKGLRTISLLHKLVAEFISQNANSEPLITVTGVNLSRDSKRADVFVSVYPEEKEEVALSYLSRKNQEVRSYVAKHSKLKRLPRFSFSLDYGEKNRRRIEDISKDLNQ